MRVMNPRTVIAEISAPTGDIGAAFYFHPDTLGRGKELGLDGFRFYILGRGGVLGDVAPEVVSAAFGYFNPELIAKLWTSAKEKLAPRKAAEEYLACNATLGRQWLSGVEGLDAYNEAAEAVIAAVDVAGLSLFAGIKAEPVPTDSAARAIHNAVLLRELRGSAHLVAVRAVGLDSHIAHAIKRPGDMATFGWGDDVVVTDADRERLARAETITDDVLESAFAVLSDAQAAALIAGTKAMHAAIKK
jgi:hypothetical protein